MTTTPVFDADGRPEPPIAGDETATLLGSLERMRFTFWWKCEGVDPAGQTLRIGASELTLGGLLHHLALAERHTFSWKLWGRNVGEPWRSIDWDADPQYEFRTGSELPLDEVMATYVASVQHARAEVAEAIAAGGLDHPAHITYPDGRTPSLRRLLVDMIEEYGRHTGHADLLREAVDGRTGEDAPWPPERPTPLWG